MGNISHVLSRNINQVSTKQVTDSRIIWRHPTTYKICSHPPIKITVYFQNTSITCALFTCHFAKTILCWHRVCTVFPFYPAHKNIGKLSSKAWLVNQESHKIFFLEEILTPVGRCLNAIHIIYREPIMYQNNEKGYLEIMTKCIPSTSHSAL